LYITEEGVRKGRAVQKKGRRRRGRERQAEEEEKQERQGLNKGGRRGRAAQEKGGGGGRKEEGERKQQQQQQWPPLLVVLETGQQKGGGDITADVIFSPCPAARCCCFSRTAEAAASRFPHPILFSPMHYIHLSENAEVHGELLAPIVAKPAGEIINFEDWQTAVAKKQNADSQKEGAVRLSFCRPFFFLSLSCA
jgi:hypothetical protein